MKTLLGDYNDGPVFNTATQVDFNQLSMLPEHHNQRLEPVLRSAKLVCFVLRRQKLWAVCAQLL